MIVTASEESMTIRAYEDRDYDEFADLFVRVTRALEMRALFEEYIATAINGELNQLREVFSESQRNAFWIVEIDQKVIGAFGIEAGGANTTELRRMHLDERYRGRGVAQRLLQCAEVRALELGFSKMILSTAEVQKAAIAFYRKSGYQLIRTERAEVCRPRQSVADLRGFTSRKHLAWGEAALARHRLPAIRQRIGNGRGTPSPSFAREWRAKR